MAELFSPSDGLEDWRAHEAEEERLHRDAAILTADEAQWLADRIGRDGAFDEAERAVIETLRKEAPQLHPRLQALLDGAPDALRASA